MQVVFSAAADSIGDRLSWCSSAQASTNRCCVAACSSDSASRNRQEKTPTCLDNTHANRNMVALGWVGKHSDYDPEENVRVQALRYTERRCAKRQHSGKPQVRYFVKKQKQPGPCRNPAVVEFIVSE